MKAGKLHLFIGLAVLALLGLDRLWYTMDREVIWYSPLHMWNAMVSWGKVTISIDPVGQCAIFIGCVLVVIGIVMILCNSNSKK